MTIEVAKAKALRLGPVDGLHPTLDDEAAKDGAPGDGRPERLRVWAERSWRQLQREVLRDPSPSGQDDGNYNYNYNGNYNGNSNDNGEMRGSLSTAPLTKRL